MTTKSQLSTHSFLRALAGILVAVWLVILILAVAGAMTASTAAGALVGSLVGGGMVALGVWIGLRRAEAAEADSSRLDALEPLPPRER